MRSRAHACWHGSKNKTVSFSFFIDKASWGRERICFDFCFKRAFLFAFCVYLFSVNTGEFGRKRRGNDAPIGETCRADHGSAGGFDYSLLEKHQNASRETGCSLFQIKEQKPCGTPLLKGNGFCTVFVYLPKRRNALVRQDAVSPVPTDKRPNSLTRACLWRSPLSRPHLLRKHKRHIFPDRLRRSSSARHIGAAFHPWQGAS